MACLLTCKRLDAILLSDRYNTLKVLSFAITGLTILSGAPAALAAPDVYTAAWLQGRDLASCLARAKEVATQNGFKNDHETVMDDDRKAASFFATSDSLPLALTVRCRPTEGLISIGVAGNGDNTRTFRVFDKVVKDY